MVSIKIHQVNVTQFHGSYGMMGEFGGEGRMLARDGATVIEDPNDLAAEWQVRGDERRLFQAPGTIQYPEACQLPDENLLEQRRLEEHALSTEIAEEACQTWGVENLEACVYDVIATGDLDFAAAASI